MRFTETDGPAVVKKEERARVEIKMIQITLESGAGHHTVPLLIAELSVEGKLLLKSKVVSGRCILIDDPVTTVLCFCDIYNSIVLRDRNGDDNYNFKRNNKA